MPTPRATRRLSRRSWIGLIVAAVTAVWVAIAALSGPAAAPTLPGSGATAAQPGSLPPGTATPGRSGTTQGDPGPNGATAAITVVPSRERAPQPYRRAAFGRAWTDDQSALLGHNGCDTRNDILDRDLRDKTYTRTSQCPRAVATGTLIDPYSGSSIDFVRGATTSARVQIDHVISVAVSRGRVIIAAQHVDGMPLIEAVSL